MNSIIEKWYKRLEFPEKFDKEFYESLNSINVPSDTSIENYDMNEKDGKKNLLSYLYMCEELSKNYAAKGISDCVLIATLKDIVVWTSTWSNLKGELYLGEISWLSQHLRMKLFRLGRLQFCIGKSEHDVFDIHLQKGDDVVEIHIPEGSPLDYDACKESIAFAKDFFEKYFPEYSYDYLTTHSWLLDKTLEKFLKPDSNILKFQDLFDIVCEDKSDAILKYVFKWDADREYVKNHECNSDFLRKIKEHVLHNGDFYENLGVIRKKTKTS